MCLMSFYNETFWVLLLNCLISVKEEGAVEGAVDSTWVMQRASDDGGLHWTACCLQHLPLCGHQSHSQESETRMTASARSRTRFGSGSNKRLKMTLFIRTQHNIRIFGVRFFQALDIAHPPKLISGLALHPIFDRFWPFNRRLTVVL